VVSVRKLVVTNGNVLPVPVLRLLQVTTGHSAVLPGNANPEQPLTTLNITRHHVTTNRYTIALNRAVAANEIASSLYSVYVFVCYCSIGVRCRDVLNSIVSETGQPLLQSQPRGRTPVPIVQQAGWTPEPVWTQRLVEKSFRLCLGSKLDCSVVTIFVALF
jgi:hypothetical protein